MYSYLLLVIITIPVDSLNFQTAHTAIFLIISNSKHSVGFKMLREFTKIMCASVVRAHRPRLSASGNRDVESRAFAMQIKVS